MQKPFQTAEITLFDKRQIKDSKLQSKLNELVLNHCGFDATDLVNTHSDIP